MRWTPGDRGNIEDNRGRSGGGIAGLGIGGFLILLVLSWATGTNLFSLLGTDTASTPGSVGTSGEVKTSPAEEKMVDFVDAVTGDAQKTWQQILGSRY
jgi:predicted metalloprotease